MLESQQNTSSGQVTRPESEITSRSVRGASFRTSPSSDRTTKITKSPWQIETEARMERLESDYFNMCAHMMEMYDLMIRMAQGNCKDHEVLAQLQIASWRNHPPDSENTT